ncbi:hypothetical protein K469DRAFT_616646 [Zopfia rhizophila CBS 207.26]|uniref:Uncharacterized protein n=1 Tax=Zopfia rhizophila CBS 207.26 TaxID=1314779 RepID=A0A6A6EW51_9PEZI|nr:hypothetical protein K469DRAFT_616646 [Zopfia rhizophila CBS 207.26]
MIKLSSLFQLILVFWSVSLVGEVWGEVRGEHAVRSLSQNGQHYRPRPRQNGQNGNQGGNGGNNGNNGNNGNKNNNNNGQPDTSAFNIVNGRIFTPGLGIILAPQPFTPMGGDFLHIALDVSGDGKLPVPPLSTADPLTEIFNITLFLTSNTLQKNFTISNITTNTPPFANIMLQEPGQTVKHINFEWPDCLVGDGKEDIGTTARGEYNISIHQNFRLNGSEHYSIFNLPIQVTNSIPQFPGADQLLTKPPPGPLSVNGGRMNCDSISNPLMDINQLVQSVNNPPGQPFQDIAIETTAKDDKGGGGQVGGPGNANPNPNGGNIGNNPGNAEGQVGFAVKGLRASVLDAAFAAGLVILGTSVGW